MRRPGELGPRFTWTPGLRCVQISPGRCLPLSLGSHLLPRPPWRAQAALGNGPPAGTGQRGPGDHAALGYPELPAEQEAS